MKTKIQKVYHCEYCNKISINKGAMTRHEKKCKENPDNQHSCFWCIYKYTFMTQVNEETAIREFYCKNPKCKFFDKPLHTYKLDGALRVYYYGLTRMPTNCSHFKAKFF